MNRRSFSCVRLLSSHTVRTPSVRQEVSPLRPRSIMNEHDSDEQHSEEQHPPRWVPYTPPPPDGWDRLRFFVRRISFPVMVLLFIAGVAGGLYWSLYLEPDVPARPNLSVVSETTRSQAEKGPARLTLHTVPEGASVRVNGDSIGATPLMGRSLDSGVYMLSVQSEGYFRADTVVVLGAGAESTLRLRLRPRPGTDVAATRPEAPDRPSNTSAQPPSPTRPRAERTPSKTTPSTPAPPASKPKPPRLGALYVTSTPAGATVRVGGTEKGRAPVAVSNLPVGPVRIGLSMEGYNDWTTEVEVRPDTTQQVRATLQPRSGRLRVLARPWGTIYVNGALKARESDIWYETTLPAGTYRVTAVHPTLGQRVQEVQVSPDEETSVVIDLQEAATSEAAPRR